MNLLTDLELHSMRGDRNLLQGELERAGVQFRGKACRCIFHDDKHASAGIWEEEGVWRFTCQACKAGGDIFDVRAALNKTSVEDELRKEAERRHGPALRQPVEPATPTYASVEEIAAKYKVEAIYRYTDPATGKVDMAVIRHRLADGSKRFKQCTPAPGGRWFEKGPEGPRPLYNRARIVKADTVVVVEGEKCVHALHDLGIVATTSPQGALSAGKADWTPLAGKRCIIWRDNDAAGAEYSEKVQKALLSLDPPVSLSIVAVEPLELPAGGDVVDFIDRYKGWTKGDAAAAVWDALNDARAIGVMGDYVKETDEVIAGNRKAIHFAHFQRLTNASRALVPGTVTCLFGPPGATKSLLMMECLIEWTSHGTKACAYMLEDNRTYHMRRAHAQMACRSCMTDNEWVENNPDEFRKSRAEVHTQLEELGRRIWDAPDDEISFEMLEVWVEERAKAGYEIIIVDPTTAAQSKDKVWVADQRFMFRVKNTARRYNTRIILVTHPRKGQKAVMVGLDDMAGGAAYQRFSHTVLLIERNDKDEEVSIKRTFDSELELYKPDRFIWVKKARNGPGAGARIAFDFDKQTLRFKELGMVQSL